MSKSNYKLYVDNWQKELLQESHSLSLCLTKLKDNKKHFSQEYIEA